MDRQMPLRLRALAFVLGKLESFLLHRGKHAGLAGLTLRRIRAVLAAPEGRARRGDSDRRAQNVLHHQPDCPEAAKALPPRDRVVSSDLLRPERRHDRLARPVDPGPGHLPGRPRGRSYRPDPPLSGLSRSSTASPCPDPGYPQRGRRRGKRSGRGSSTALSATPTPGQLRAIPATCSLTSARVPGRSVLPGPSSSRDTRSRRVPSRRGRSRIPGNRAASATGCRRACLA